MKTKDLVLTALFSAIICVLAPWSIPIGAVPVSLASLAVLLTATVLDLRQSTLAVLCYIVLGAVGVPVFSGFSGGAGCIAGPTGGFILGYLPCALITSALIGRGVVSRRRYPLAMLAGTVALYACGTAWFALQMNVTLAYALGVCVLPFLFSDAVKIAAVSLLSPTLKKRIFERRR